MAYDNTNPEPLYISESSDRLTPIEVSGNRYTFEHISINGIPVMDCPPGVTPDEVDEDNVASFFPQNTDTAICFQTIGDLIGEKTTDGAKHLDFIEKGYDKVPYFENVEDLKKKHCAFITPNGTICPQILYCGDFGNNDISLSTDGDEEKKWEKANENKGYHWVAQVPTEENVLAKNPKAKGNEEELRKALKIPRHFGIQYDIANTRRAEYISILGRHPLIDAEGKFERTYISNFPATGAFAILLDIPAYEDDPTGKNPPQVSFQFLNDDSSKSSSGSSVTDVVSIVAVPNGNVTASVGENSFTDSLNFSQMGTKIVHTNSTALASKNVIFVYPLMNSLIVTGDLNTAPNNKVGTKNIIVKKQKDLDILKKTEPPLNEYPSEHKKGRANEILLNTNEVYVNFGNRCQSVWKNCIGSFALAALRFCPIVKFSYFFKVSGEYTNESVNGDSSNAEDYFCLEVGGKNGNFKGLSGKQKAKFVVYDAETQVSTFRVDFEVTADSASNGAELQLYPFEIFGLVHITKRNGKLTDVLNEDGVFSTGFSNNVENKYSEYTGAGDGQGSSGTTSTPNTGAEWTDYITSVNVSHGLDGTSGSITIDKFMMMDLAKKPSQSIGALTLVANNGLYKSGGETRNGKSYTYNRSGNYPALPWGQIFRGYGMEISDNVSEGNGSLTIKLIGIQKKMSDMKLVNCPFWDGDAVFSAEGSNDPDAVLSYMISYSGCDLKHIRAFSDSGTSVEDIILPRSFDWQAPSTNFVLGTPVLDAVKEIAKKINHQFVIQPDGRGYFYHMDDYGCPEWVRNGPIVMSYKESDIISMDIAPYIENRYNTFLTLGLLVKNDTEAKQIVPDGCKPGMKFSGVKPRTDDYPWSRIITNRESGLVTIKDLERFHKTNVKFGSSDVFQGTIVVPGFHGFFIFDKIQIECDNSVNLQFYITGINHNINLQTKDWTTSLSVASFEVGDPSTEDMEM